MPWKSQNQNRTFHKEVFKHKYIYQTCLKKYKNYIPGSYILKQLDTNKFLVYRELLRAFVYFHP